MHMRMMLQRLSPGVQHAQESEFRAQAFGIRRDLQQRRRTGAEQQIVEQFLVVMTPAERASAAA